MNPSLPVENDTRIWDAWLGLYQPLAISVALELAIFEHLREPADVATLRQRTGYSERGLNALLAMLKRLGMLDRHQAAYQLNEVSRAYMLKDSPFFWGPFFARMSQGVPAHKLLLENVRDDKTSETRAAEGWESGQVDDAAAKAITDFMHCHSIAPAVGMTQTCDFSGVKRLLDVGGGSGCYATSIAAANPGMRATVMDLPSVCKVANGYIERAGLSGRVDTQAVDMFRQPWPRGYDAHFFANVFHDWSPDTCASLAASSFAALADGGRICLQEMLLDDAGDGPTTTVAFSLLMCLGTKGQQFTLGQLKDILERAGFSDITSRRSYGYYSLVTGFKR
ncbi:MAG TPA: methyltransferase [Terriglobia bacterium]|nr:methyltransferase [Terriglobia bacterium]